jgi:hypothetical protein
VEQNKSAANIIKNPAFGANVLLRERQKKEYRVWVKMSGSRQDAKTFEEKATLR